MCFITESFALFGPKSKTSHRTRSSPKSCDILRFLDERSECKPDRAQPSRDERSECKPDRAQPSRDERSECKPDRAQPYRDERSECKPDRAQPYRDERSECKPDRAQPYRIEFTIERRGMTWLHATPILMAAPY